ncbi:hypothetical protein ACKI2N_031890 [Cupriavidus sp. 30B13]|uniref:hypothetical protein n=1 Tax=Cupriavidus sp. 30B13 TaxID=3384241 RepID=UPI003B8F4D5B
MAIYLTVTFNHFRAVQRWLAESGAQATMNPKDFTLEIKHRNRYYLFHPLFQGEIDGKFVHFSTLTDDAIRFGGWRPYRTLQHPHSTDKLLFKRYLASEAIRTPAMLTLGDGVPDFDYLLKGSVGSFGYELAGPFRAGTPIDLTSPRFQEKGGTTFVEQFVPGKMLKVWFWGKTPFFAHAQDFPKLVCDGSRSVERLLRERLQRAGETLETFSEMAFVKQCLAYQGVTLDAVPPEGQEYWIDYRYSRVYMRSGRTSSQSDSQLAMLQKVAGDQLSAMGEALVKLTWQTYQFPVMLTCDAMLDEHGQIWWLEMNTNSLMPPEGYAVMFGQLFA